MKKRVVVLVSIVVLFLSGCSLGKKVSVPGYFRPIVKELKESELLFSDSVGKNIWWTEGKFKGSYKDKVYTAYIGEEPYYTFDLQDELIEGEEWNWDTGGIFQENEGRIYICLVDFTLVYEGGTMQNPQIILIDFPASHPEDYQVTPYTIEPYGLFSWLDKCYRMGDKIYIGSREDLGAIDLHTKQFYYYTKEYPFVREYVKEKFGEEYGAFFFRAVLEQDEVTVYSVSVGEADDFPMFWKVFAAFKDNKPIAYMSIRLTGEDVLDSIEIEILH